MRPASESELQEIIKQGRRILPCGNCTKPALSTPPENTTSLDMTQFAGILEYEPSEYTFTALAGTRLVEVADLLAKNGQYLPFDPPLVKHGATLGGTVAAGLSGSGRYHYGGVRDFLLGVSFVDGKGQVLCGGGRVVKNSAGFDLPKLMVGSRGSLGVLVKLSMKIFPRPEAYCTLLSEHEHLDSALAVMAQVAGARLDIDCLDLESIQPGYRLWIRIAGFSEVIPSRAKRLVGLLENAMVITPGDEEAAIWQEVCEMSWVPDGWSVLKVPLTPGRISTLEASLANKQVFRRYVADGQFAWLASPDELQSFEPIFLSMDLSALVLRGAEGRTRLGVMHGESFLKRVKDVLDPAGCFVEA